MIEKLEKHIIGENAPGVVSLMVAPTAEQQVDKINELCDVVNALIQENNIHEKQIDELQMKAEPKIELDRTRKALDAAICGLDQMTWGCDSSDAEHLLKEIKEITALEQKDN